MRLLLVVLALGLVASVPAEAVPMGADLDSDEHASQGHRYGVYKLNWHSGSWRSHRHHYGRDEGSWFGAQAAPQAVTPSSSSAQAPGTLSPNLSITRLPEPATLIDPVVQVPEPATLLTIGMGLLVCMGLMWLRRRWIMISVVAMIALLVVSSEVAAMASRHHRGEARQHSDQDGQNEPTGNAHAQQLQIGPDAPRPTAAVPEPGTILLAGSGLVTAWGLYWLKARRRRG